MNENWGSPRGLNPACTVIAAAAVVVRAGQTGAPVQQDLDDLVVVGVGGEDEGRHVGGEHGLLLTQRLPGPGLALQVDALLVVQQHLDRLDILLVYGVEESVLGLGLHFKFLVCFRNTNSFDYVLMKKQFYTQSLGTYWKFCKICGLTRSVNVNDRV